MLTNGHMTFAEQCRLLLYHVYLYSAGSVSHFNAKVWGNFHWYATITHTRHRVIYNYLYLYLYLSLLKWKLFASVVKYFHNEAKFLNMFQILFRVNTELQITNWFLCLWSYSQINCFCCCFHVNGFYNCGFPRSKVILN